MNITAEEVRISTEIAVIYLKTIFRHSPGKTQDYKET
jgi:hypothetical protein